MNERTASGFVCVGIGGTGIKAAPVGIAAGKLAAGRLRLLTPSLATLEAVGEVLECVDVAGPVEVRRGPEDPVPHHHRDGQADGIGSAPLADGTPVPSSELGHLPLHREEAEHWAAESVRGHDEPARKKYAHWLQAYLELAEQVLWPRLITIRGGISKKAGKFLPRIELRTPIVPAQPLNDAGIIGAALCALGG